MVGSKVLPTPIPYRRTRRLVTFLAYGIVRRAYTFILP